MISSKTYCLKLIILIANVVSVCIVILPNINELDAKCQTILGIIVIMIEIFLIIIGKAHENNVDKDFLGRLKQEVIEEIKPAKYSQLEEARAELRSGIKIMLACAIVYGIIIFFIKIINLQWALVGGLVMIIAYIYFIWIFFTVIQAIVAGGEVYAIVIRIVKTKCIGGVAEVLKHPPISLFLINTIMCLYLVYTVSTYDNRVCSKANYKPKKRCISLSQNIIMILVIYAGYIFLAINISQNANVFSVITCIFAILLSGCIEDFFREDICNRQWYRLLGEKYSGLWCKKMMVELKIQFVVFAAYLICAFIHKYDVKIVFMVLIYMVECGLCWVTYFALYYVKMKKRYTTLEMMKLYAAMFSITVPGINILLCAWWYVRGARRRNEYVRDL